jgi:hypothetical protein
MGAAGSGVSPLAPGDIHGQRTDLAAHLRLVESEQPAISEDHLPVDNYRAHVSGAGRIG